MGVQRTVDSLIDHYIGVDQNGSKSVAYALFTLAIIVLLYFTAVFMERAAAKAEANGDSSAHTSVGALFGLSMPGLAIADQLSKPPPPPVEQNVATTATMVPAQRSIQLRGAPVPGRSPPQSQASQRSLHTVSPWAAVQSQYRPHGYQ
jgi:hypothetical protein